jgi:hypothetical protein
MERMKETVNTGRFFGSGRSKSYQAERRVEPLVLPSEISGLPRLQALLKVDNLVVPFGFPYLAPQKLQPGFIPRETTASPAGKLPSVSGTQLAQEIDPHGQAQASGIAAGQDPHFE